MRGLQETPAYGRRGTGYARPPQGRGRPPHADQRRNIRRAICFLLPARTPDISICRPSGGTPLQSRGFLQRPSTFRSVCRPRSEEHTSELQSLMRISYAVFFLKKKNKTKTT